MSTGPKENPTYDFGPFRLDPAERLVLRDGQVVPLTPKAFDLLVYLVEHHGHLVEKSTLLSALWPDAVVEEANLAYNVSALRKVLDRGNGPSSVIETVPTRGYRFVAPVIVSSIPPGDSTTISLPGGPELSRGSFSAHRVGVGVVAVGLLTGAWLYFAPAHTKRTPTQMAVPENTITRLTANPAEQSVKSARISPDGKYLAYADATGIRVRRIDGGDTHSIVDTKDMDVFGWTSDSENVTAVVCTEGSCSAWNVPITGGPRTPTGATWSDNQRAAISANGSQLLTVTESGEIAVTLLNGSAPPRVVAAGTFEWTRAAALSVDGSRVFFTSKGGAGIESVSAHGGATALLHSVPKNWTLVSVGPALADGRLLFVTAREKLAKPFPSSSARAIWQIDTKRPAGKSDAARVTEWRDEDIEQVSASTDGKRIAFLSTEQQWDVYTAAFDPAAMRLDTPTRLTRDDRDDIASAWMPDNSTVLFYSSRNGTSDLFRQRFDSDIAIPVIGGPGNQSFPRVTGDGRWLLFFDDGGTDRRDSVNRLPLTGGVPERVITPIDGVVHCAVRGRCVIGEVRGNEAVVSSLDPLRGRGPALFRQSSDVVISGASLSGDGSEWAFIIPAEPGTPQRIRIVRFDNGSVRDIVVRNTGRIYTLDWLPSGGGFFTCEATLGTSFSLGQMAQRSKLVFIPMDGQARTLWTRESLLLNWATPSPDGKRVALNVASRRSNAWMVSGP